MTWKAREPMPNFLQRRIAWWTQRLNQMTDPAQIHACELEIWLLSKSLEHYANLPERSDA